MKSANTKALIKHFIFCYNDIMKKEEEEYLLNGIMNALNNKTTEVLNFNEDTKIVIYGELTSEIKKNNSNVIFIYKSLIEDEELNSILFVKEDIPYDVFCDYKYEIMEIEREKNYDRNKLFQLNSLEEFREDSEYFVRYLNKEKMKDFIGEDSYNLFNDHFLKEYTLLVKNAIYNIF